MTSSEEILVVHPINEESTRLVEYLKSQGYATQWVDSDEKALNAVEQTRFSIVITHVLTSRIEGMRLIDLIRKRIPEVGFITLGDLSQRSLLIESLTHDVMAFQTSPYTHQELQAAIQHIKTQQELLFETYRLRRMVSNQYHSAQLGGQSRAISQVFEGIQQAAHTNTPIILLGPSGSGKDWVAKTIHQTSAQNKSSLIKLPAHEQYQSLWEKDILGIPNSSGGETGDVPFERLSQSHQGTLLLDNMQGFSSLYHNQILELLSGREVKSPHAPQPLSVDFRLIVTLQAPIASTDPSGEFLTQIQNRFHAITLELPALIDRIEDLPILTNQLVMHLCEKHEREAPEVHPEVIRIFERHTWPDNIRELENTLESILLTHADISMIETRHIPEGIHRQAQKEPHEMTFKPGMSIEELERHAIEETLRFCNFNKEECAKILGIGLRTLYRKLDQYKQE
jgi:two-component system response regulator HydG